MSKGDEGGDILHIDCGSTRTFEFPGGFRLTCDVIAVSNGYYDDMRALRDDDGKIPVERYTESNARLVLFVTALLQDAAKDACNRGKSPPQIDTGHANQFLKMVLDEYGRLQDFFTPASRGPQSSRESSQLTLSTSADEFGEGLAQASSPKTFSSAS